MAGEATDTGSNIALDAMSGRATQTARTTYLMLLKSVAGGGAAPTDTTSFATLVTNEVTTAGSNGYSRQAVTWSAPALDTGVPATKNSGALTFGPFTADLPEVGYAALVSASTGSTGDVIFYWTLDTARDPANGDSIQFAVDALVMKVD